MATLQEYYDNDFTHVLNITRTFIIQTNENKQIEIFPRVHQDKVANAKYISCFLPEQADPIATMIAIVNQVDLVLSPLDGWDVHNTNPGEEAFNTSELAFTGLIYFYTEKDIPEQEFKIFQKEASAQGLSIRLRGKAYALSRSQREKPLAFICHDSRDKEEVARPIAIGLSKSLCPVWYDDFSLKVGDRLRESIEKGLKECKKCIIVLSPNFFNNNGWTKTEFDSVFTRELIEQTDCILPVWFGVTKEQVYEYSPSLANRVGANWSLGREEVIRRLSRAIL